MSVMPTEEQIQETIEIVHEILADGPIDLEINRKVKEGYQAVLVILQNRVTTYVNFPDLSNLQSRAMAALAIDYLNGECTQQHLCGVRVIDPEKKNH